MPPSENLHNTSLGYYAVEATADERRTFITQTYLHLAGAVTLFVVLEAILLSLPGVDRLVQLMIGQQYSWLIVLGLFMVVSYVANNWALSAVKPSTQYMGLLLYVVAEAVIFVPLLYIARAIDPSIVTSAGVATLGLFAVLTAVVFLTRQDFSFLRTILVFGGFAAFGLIVVAIVFQFNLGPIFVYAMIAFACAYILYATSNVLHHYRIGQHVAASLALFAAVALLFWYIVQLFLSRRN